jgi:uncharacterized membrane protein
VSALGLIKGKPGKPSHPPLTDASIGAYTAGVVMLVLGALGVEEEQMAHGALLAISVGLALALPTALTGLLDWLELPRGTPVRRVATIHLFVMVTATILFAATWIAQLGGYKDDEVRGLALVLGLVAFAALAVGGNVGGANVFVYGIRVLKREDVPVAKALSPLGIEPAQAPAEPTLAERTQSAGPTGPAPPVTNPPPR